MPTISIIVAAYNVKDYITDCLSSITRQTFQDFEAIVVDDASTDGTAELVAEAAARDPRIIPVTHTINRGLHLARKTGVERASGDYAFFLDGDDDLSETMCADLVAQFQKHPVDILHYGITVIGENGILDEECRTFEAFNNTPSADTQGMRVVRSIYDEHLGQQVDWRVTQRAYRTELLKRAFGAMTDQRLERAEDGYECLVLSALAASYHACKDCRGYRYHYGRGVTGTNAISAETYGRFCRQFHDCFAAADDFATVHAELDLDSCVRGFKHKATELLSNDWKVRVRDNDKMDAAKQMADIFSPTVTAREIWRHIRDAAWDDLSDPDRVAMDTITLWQTIADTVDVGPSEPDEAPRYWQTRSRAEELLKQLRRAQERRSYDGQPIRIFITTHKNVDKPDSRILQPVQVGLKPDSYRFPWAFHDDEGENISAKNPMYCELTTQYWAWKNIDAEYYGFCHYRRYFDFSDTEHAENPYGEIMDDYIDADAIREYGFDDETIVRAVQGYDVITTRYGDLTKIIDAHGTPKKVWEAAPKLLDEDLHRMYDILCRMHPDYKQDAIAFLNGNRSCFCNMFIMRKPIFQEYCVWLFPLLEEFERCTDMSRYSKEALRTPGHLAERLLNIYLMHHKRIGTNWRTKELQCVHFTNPEPQETLQPLPYDKVQLPVVPVVFAADDNYVPQLGTTIYSAMANASKDRHYDVVVLQRNIAWDKQERLRAFFQQFDNMTLRFINVDRLVSGVNLTTNNAHISVETYYRFLIQQVLPFYDKVLYLDSDIIINGDIAELYDTELGENLLAAVPDIDFLGNLNVKHGLRMGYAKDVLHMQDPYAYFQAGVLVLNTRAMREHYTMRQWLEYASNHEYIYNDQDVLNAHCEGKVTFLDWSWNVMHDCAGRVSNVFSLAPNSAYDAYMASREHPKIIHYAGFVKPWTDPDCDFASIYWRYARETPFYERLLKKVVQSTAPQPKTPNTQHERAIGEGNALRKVIDPLMPIGSKRRETAKAVGRLIRGKH